MEKIDIYSTPLDETSYDIQTLLYELKDLMWRNVGIIRSEKGLLDAKLKITNMTNTFKRSRKCLNREEYEYRRVEEEALVAYVLYERACYDRSNDLRRHTEGIVKSREFSNVATVAHFDNHREAVDVDRCPRNSNQRKERVKGGIEGAYEKGIDEACQEA